MYAYTAEHPAAVSGSRVQEVVSSGRVREIPGASPISPISPILAEGPPLQAWPWSAAGTALHLPEDGCRRCIGSTTVVTAVSHHSGASRLVFVTLEFVGEWVTLGEMSKLG